MKKKLFSIVVSILLIFSVVIIPIFVFASTSQGDAEVPLLQNGDYDSVLLTSSDPISSSYDDLSAKEQNIYTRLINCNDTILFGIDKKLELVDFKKMYTNVINDFPELFYVSTSFKYTTTFGYVTKVYPGYSMTQSEIAGAKVIYEQGAKKALTVVDDSMSDLQKALVLHDYIMNNALYCDNGDISHSAYGFFKDGNIVCAGYALTYSYLLHRVGIECEYVTSSAMEHAWNAVKINGNWYNADLTYDDLSYLDGSTNINGYMQHRLFLKSDEYFMGESGCYHHSYFTNDDCQMTDTAFDNAFWNDVTTNIIIKDKKFYYLDPNFYAGFSRLIERNESGEERELCRSYFYFVMLPFYVSYNDANGEVHTVEYKDPFCRLTYLDNRFYISVSNCIYSADFNGSRNLITNLSTYPVGIGVKDNNLTYQLYDDYLVKTIDKMEYYYNYISTGKNINYNNYPDMNNDGYVNVKDFLLLRDQLATL